MSSVARSKESRTQKRLRFPLRLFLVGWLLFTLLAVLGMYFFERFRPKYTGTTIFARYSDPAGGGALEEGITSFETMKRTLEQDLVGREAVGRVADELRITNNPMIYPRDPEGKLTEDGQKTRQEMIRKLQEDITVDWSVQERDVDLISVSVTHSDPDLARKIPNALVKNYINRVCEQIKYRLAASRDFLLNQVRKCGERVMHATREKIEFETRHAGMMPESPGAMDARIQKIISDLDILRQEKNAAALKIVRFTTQLKRIGITFDAPPSTTQPGTQPVSQPVEWVKELNPERKRLEEQLRESEEYLNNALISGMKEKYPAIRTIRAKIANLKKRHENEPEWIAVRKTITRTGISAVEQAFTVHIIAADLAAAKSDYETITAAIERNKALLATYEPMMKNFAKIRQDYLRIIKMIYKEQDDMDRWQARLTVVQMALEAEAAMRRTHLRTLQVAQAERKLPDWLEVLGLAFGIGVIFSGVLSILIMFFRRWTVMTIICLLLLAGIAAATFLLVQSGNGPDKIISTAPLGCFIILVTNVIPAEFAHWLR